MNYLTFDIDWASDAILQETVSLLKKWNDLVRIIYNGEDDVHWIYKKSFDDLDINPVALNEYFTLRLLRTCYDG